MNCAIGVPSTGAQRGHLFKAIGIFCLGIASASQAQMTIPGQFEVTEMGAATYSIPLDIPVSTGGLKPSLSLAYNAQAGNGLLGVGWNIAGLSAISRCPQTIAQDGVRVSVNYSLTDRYCLNGQRLMAISGVEGEGGTQYRTEKESFSKVISYTETGATGGPGSFMVKTKEGLTMEFGKTADSRIEAQGKSVVAVWALNRVYDTKGNYFTVSYIEDNANGQFYPSKIDYTGNVLIPTGTFASVSFVYEARSDIVPFYSLGSVAKTTVRLARVEAQVAGVQAPELRLNYEQSPSTGRSRIVSMVKCAGKVCLPATSFSWATQDPPLSLGFTSSLSDTYFNAGGSNAGVLTNSNFGTRMADINGDGRQDIIQLYLPHDGSYGGVPQKRIFLNDGFGFYLDATYSASLPTTYFSSGSSNAGVLTYADFGTDLIDVNGDGLPDLVQLFLPLDGAYGGVPQRRIFLNTGRDFVANAVFSASLPDAYFTASGSNAGVMTSSYFGTQMLDVNGDGLPDIVQLFLSLDGAYQGVPQKRIYLNTGTAFAHDTSYSQSLTDTFFSAGGSNAGQLTSSTHGTQMTDINGDGLPDIIQLFYPLDGSYGGAPQRRVFLNKNNRFTFDSFYSATLTDTYFGAGSSQAGVLSSSDFGTRLADLNGDGLQDLIQIFLPLDGAYGRNPQRRVFMNTGAGFVHDATFSASIPDAYFSAGTSNAGNLSSSDFGTRLADINGDGLPDLLQLFLPLDGAYGGAPQRRVLLNTGTKFVLHAGLSSTLPTMYFNAGGSNGGELTNSDFGTRLVDVDGDGLMELVQVFLPLDGAYGGVPQRKVFAFAHTPDLITSFRQGSGVGPTTQVLYSSLPKMFGTRYKKDLPSAYPKVTVVPPLSVVADVFNLDGVGGQTGTSFSYGNLVADLSPAGRGVLGYQWTQRIDNSTGAVSRTYYRQDWPYIGLVDKSGKGTTEAGWSNLSLTVNTSYTCNAIVNSTGISAPCTTTGGSPTVKAGSRYFLYPNQTDAQAWDYDGRKSTGGTFFALPRTRTTQVLDSYGNVTMIKLETLKPDGSASGHSNTTNSVYAPADITKWHLGRLVRSSVTVTAP